MSTPAPWNYQPTSESQGGVKLFNPAQFQQNGPVQPSGSDQTNQSSWGQGWSTDNQYGNYNTVGDTNAGTQQVNQGQGQNVQGEGEQYGSQQFYNLNPGIQQGYNQPNQQVNQGQPIQYDEKGQPTQQYDQHGQPIQYDEKGQPIQQYVQQGQSVQYDQNGQPVQYDQNGQPIQYNQPVQYDQNGQPMQYGEQQQQYDQQNQQYYNYDSQGQVYDHNYGWNNQAWDGYRNQQNWGNSETQGTENSNEVGNSEGVTDNPPNNTNEGVQILEPSSTEGENSDFQHSDKTGSDNVYGDNILNTSGEGYDHFTRDEPEMSSKPNQISNLPMSQSITGEISSESLVTLNSSGNQLVSSENEDQTIANQMENMSLGEKSKENNEKHDTNHSAIDGQGVSVEGGQKSSNQSKDSPVSQNSQTSDDWEMVPPANTLMAPSNHSRQGSADNPVQFFIGSTDISPSGTPPVNSELNTGDKKPEESSPTSNMIPKHASSPMPPRVDVPPPMAKSGPPPVTGAPPPTAMGSSDGNPFRKGKGSDAKSGHPVLTNISKNEESSPSANLKLDTAAAAVGYPSPIQTVAEEATSSDSQSQSPIMPRKESPFQPPRRRNLSQSSNSFDDEYSPMHSDKGQVGDELRRDSGFDRRGTDRKMGPMKADRSLVASSSSRHQDSGIDYSRFPNRGKDERRPRSPLNSGRNLGGGRTTPTKPPTGRTTPTKAGGRTTPGRNTPSRRLEQAAYQKAVERRKKENISPATSLWANNDEVPKANILLAPAAPVQGSSGSAIMPVLGLIPQSLHKTNPETNQVLSPVENLISSISNNLSRENSPEKDSVKSKPFDRDGLRRDTTQRDRHERNSSIDREIEMTKRMDERDRVRENERSYRDDRTRGPRDDRYRDDQSRDSRDYRDRERDLEREKYYEAYYQRHNRQSQRDPYYGDERYERPRSRQSTVDDRAPSRQTEASDRGRYDRDQYYRDRYGRGYYDYYGNNRQQYGYYDQRYQDYYGDSRYGKAYYDEYYNGQYSDNYDRMSRYDYSWQQAGYYDHYRNDDSYSTRSESRVHTPGSLSDSGDQLEGYQRSRASSRQGYDDYNRGHYDPYYGYGYGDYYNNSYVEPEPPGRLTPEKYTLPHMCARFGPGGHLIKVMPNRPKEGQTATVEIHDISMMLEDRPEVEELKCYPGPLVRNDTHKNDVLSFCQQKAKACSENIDMTDRESAELIWRLLEVLIKQNGMIVGTDIADLLLQGHEPTTAEYSIMGMKISSSTDNLEADLDDTELSNITMDRSVVSKGHRSREEVTDRFRHLLMYGRKKDALEWAMKNNLWGHALFLASKMDSKAHANVMTRFANSAMKMNDPLQTLFQLMSGRQPAAVSCITDEKWGDWRPHLAMMLSNQTNKADLDRKCIMTMGDTLASRGFLHGSHFCYLMAQTGFGSYHKKTSKMVLIGSSHTLPLSEFATNEAIQCSEVYEYAMSLGNSGYFSPNLQYFKYLYACRMAENGFAQKALEYCEVIAKYINISPTVFQPALVKLVFELASRLKKFDPEKQQVGEDSEDPMWLQHLQRVNLGFEDGSIQPLSGSVTPYCFMGTRSSSASGEVAGLTDFGAGMQSGQYAGSSPYQQNQQMYQQGYDQSQMYNQAYQGYTQGQVQTEAQQPDAQTQQNQGYTGDQSQQYQSNQQVTTDQGQGQGQEYSGQGYYQGQMYQGQQVDQQQNQQYSGQEGQQTYQQQHHDLATVPESSVVGSQEYTQQNHTEDNSHQQQQQQPNMVQPTDFSMYHNAGLQNQPGHRNSLSSVGTASSHADTDDEESLGNSQRSDFDYFGAATKQQIVAPRLRKRTESESSTAGPQKSETQQKSEMKPELSDKKQQPQSKGWFGGVFSKLMPKSKNEMKLPDDKDPAIVWDPVKKKWVNQDGAVEDDKPAAPPPKDMELSSPTAPQLPPSSGTPAVGSPMGNRFGRPRGRGARTQYVDVMNPKTSGPTASVPSNIFNVMPSSHSSPAIFNPSNGNETEPSQPETDVAQPIDQRVPSGEGEPAPEMPPPSGPPSMPMLFNPSQVSSTSNVPQTGSKRLNQRRIYPKS